jgi:uncharacterized coiled-coil DUF342 family protein
MLQNTSGVEDNVISKAQAVREIVGELLDIIERMDGEMTEDRQEVKKLKETVDEYSDDLADKDSKIEELESEIASLKNEIKIFQQTIG